MTLVIFLLLLTFATSWSITYFIRKWAICKRLLDKPNQRTLHTKITPLGGGLAIAVCWFLAILFMLIFNEKYMPKELFSALLPGIILLLVGIKDDAQQVSPLIRLFIQSIAIFISMYLLGGLHGIDFGFGLWNPSPILLNIFTFISFLWIINLFNFYDGIDGNLGTESISICLLTMLFIPANNPLIFMIASLCGFLVWNWQKAKIFMGDAGSTFIGFNFAVFGIYYQNTEQISIMLWILICGVAVFDTTFTLIRRIIYRENIFTPHKNQMFHRLVLSGYSHQKVVLIQQAFNLVILAGLLFAKKDKEYILPVTIAILAIYLLYMIWVEKRYPYVRKKIK